MGIVASWAGDGAPLGAVTTSSIGDGDTVFTHISGTSTVTDDGTRPTQITLTDASEVKRVGWWQFPGYPLTTYAIRCYLTVGSLPSSSLDIIGGNHDNQESWRVRLDGNGRLRIYEPATSSYLWTGTVGVTAEQPARIELVVDNNQVTAYLYAGDGETLLDTGTATVEDGTLDELRFGLNFAAATDHWRYDDLALSDEATLIGPAALPRSPFRLWDGTAYADADLYTWDGTTYTPLVTP